MTRTEKLSRLLELVAFATAAHEAVLQSASGTQEKIKAITARRKRLKEIEDFANTASDRDVTHQALEAHGALVEVFDDSRIADIIGAARVLDGFATAFNQAADSAEKRQVLTDRWATVAERVAGSTVTMAQGARDAVAGVKARIDAIRDELDGLLDNDPANA